MRGLGPAVRLIFFAASVLSLIGCSSGRNPLAAPDVSTTARPTVTVERRDITSVIAVRGTVVATPTLVIAAPRRGPVRYTSRATPGRALRLGDVVATAGTVADAAAVRAPAAGFFVEALVPDGAPVAAGVPVATMRYEGFGASIAVPSELAYRLYDLPAQGRVEVVGGPGPSDCTLARPPIRPAGGSGEGGASASSTPLLCLLAPDARVVDGLAAVVSVVTARRSGVLTLPSLAVAGSVDVGTVTKVEADGRRHEVGVTLGISDGTRIEIVSGLSEGDRVESVAPTLQLGGP